MSYPFSGRCFVCQVDYFTVAEFEIHSKMHAPDPDRHKVQKNHPRLRPMEVRQMSATERIRWNKNNG